MDNFPLKYETYKIIGVCMDVQRTLGFGFSESVYKDAIEVEFIANNFLYQREKELSVTYKGQKSLDIDFWLILFIMRKSLLK